MIDRRQALCHIGIGLVGLTACASLPTYRATAKGQSMALDRAEIEAALQEHRVLRIRAQAWSEDVLLIKLDDGQLRGIGMTCSHLGCQVRPGGDFLVCPCHGSTFDLAGQVVRGPAQKPLKTYGIAMVDEWINITATDI